MRFLECLDQQVRCHFTALLPMAHIQFLRRWYMLDGISQQPAAVIAEESGFAAAMALRVHHTILAWLRTPAGTQALEQAIIQAVHQNRKRE